MRLPAAAVMLANLSLSFTSAEEPPPCLGGTTAIEVASTTDLQNMLNTINCTGEGTFDVTWIGNLQLEQTIEISDNKNLTITGPSPPFTVLPEAVIDAGNTTGIVSVSGGSTVKLVSLVLMGGNSHDGGAVLAHSFSSVSVIGCSILSSNGSTGGAISAHLSDIHIDGETTFAQNTVLRNGGAIYANQSEVHIDGNTLFSSNTAQHNGGAVYGINSVIYVNGSTLFANNSAENIGGAIFAQRTDVQVDGNTSFEHNSADEEAGAVYAFTADVHIAGQTYFSHNFANTSGGVFYLSNCSTYFTGTSDFRQNSAMAEGGAIFADDESSVYIDGHASFANNSVDAFGGVIGLEESEMHLGGLSSFTGNECLRSGGVIYADESRIYLTGEASFSDNSAGFDGGVVHLHSGSLMNLTGYASFESNSAVNSGGALYASTSATYYMIGTTFFSLNTAGNNGGAMCFFNVLTTNYYIGGTTTFSENVASWRGGAIYAATSEIHMNGNIAFVDNDAYDGGAIVAHDSSVTIDGNTSFLGNFANHDGGAINMLGSNATISGQAEISYNTALNGGGVFSALCPQVHLIGMISFMENTAVLDGGAISLTDPNDFHVLGTSFLSNKAGSGGAVSLATTGPTTGGFDRCRFDSNDASDGGALYLNTADSGDTENPTFIRDSVFRNNLADVSGGSIFNIGLLAINDTVFSENTAMDYGLAVMNEEPALDMSNVTFHDNMLSCLPDEYSDFDDDSTGIERFSLVCHQCLDGFEGDPSIATISSDTVPVCKELPVGVSKLTSTTLATLDLLPGYFRTSNESREVLECYREESCTGGDNALNYCATGYEGPYCAVCADSYAPGLLSSCSKCSSANSRLGIGLTAAFVILGVCIVTWLSSRSRSEAENEARFRLRRAVSSHYKMMVKVLPLSAIKIVVVVLQIVTQFTEIAGAVYPDEYEAFLSYISTVNLNVGFILSSFCIVATDFYHRLLVATLGPLALLLAIFVISFVVEMWRNRGSAETVVQGRHLSTGLFILFFVYSSVSFTIFQTFVCDELDDGNSYLRADYSVVCNTAKHDAYRTYASIMVCVYPIGFPALLGWWLARHRQQLSKPSREDMPNLHQFRGLWAAYKPSCYYYEVVECSRRVVLTGAAVFVFPNSADQIAVVLLLAVVFMFISESLSPFEEKSDMWLYRWGNGIILASMYVALLLKFELTGEESETSMGMTGLLIAANVFMVVTVIVQAVILAKRLYISGRIEPASSAPSTFWSAACASESQDVFVEGRRGRGRDDFIHEI